MNITVLHFKENYLLSTLNSQFSTVNFQLPTLNSHNTPFVDGSEKLKISRLTAIFIAFANALNMPSIL